MWTPGRLGYQDVCRAAQLRSQQAKSYICCLVSQESSGASPPPTCSRSLLMPHGESPSTINCLVRKEILQLCVVLLYPSVLACRAVALNVSHKIPATKYRTHKIGTSADHDRLIPDHDRLIPDTGWHCTRTHRSGTATLVSCRQRSSLTELPQGLGQHAPPLV